MTTTTTRYMTDIDPQPPSCPQPALQRGAMTAEPWAGPLLLRPWRRLTRRTGAKGPQAWADDVRPMRVRRLVLLALVLLGAWVGTQAMAEVLPMHGETIAEAGLLALFGILFGWISAGFWTGAIGAFVLLRGGPAPLVRGAAEAVLRPLAAGVRTAIVMPICNEHVPTVFGGLEATIESLRATGEAGHFDVYVLSDTGDADIRAAEHAAWADLDAKLRALGAEGAAAPRLHYRWRQQRRQRKAGNVADFCRRWGEAYRYFVVLDADSVMTGECLTSLVRLMESHPEAGIIQTAPKPFGHDTFHARVQQFGARAYGPLFTAGMRFWQLGESHYWGHNAILRMAPFMAHCALAPIEGRGALSGEILSHDFVEAALMRRAGWQVWVADDLDGSYEQVPPNLLAELQRDRRWCQGNLQNSRLIAEPGLHAVHRTAFLTGVLAYASSPLWLAFLLLSSLLFALHVGSEPAYFLEPYQLFPIWPSANLLLMLTLFGLTAVLLFAPKVLSIAAIIARGRAGRFGGTTRLLGSAAVEFMHSLLLAPVRMLFHSQFVLAALTGWKLDWKSPPRQDSSTGWREAIRRHGLHSLLAIGWIAVIVLQSDSVPWWLMPVLIGLVTAVPLSVWGSRVGAGRLLKRRGLLLTPEEVRTPRVLREAAEAADRVAARGVCLREAVADGAAHARAIAALPMRAAAGGDKAQAEAGRIDRAIVDGPDPLSGDDALRLLSSRPALERLRAEVLARRAHPAWWQERPVAANEAADRAGASLPVLHGPDPVLRSG